MKENKKVLQQDEIDLVELVKVIWSKKWFIAKVTGIFIVLGLIVAFTSPKEYETSCTLIPEAIESSGKFGGSLGGLASLAGVDLGGLTQGGTTINPGLYRSVAQSTPFLLELMYKNFYINSIKDSISLNDFYEDFYETPLYAKGLSLPSRLFSLFRKDSNHDSSHSMSNDSILSLSIKEQSIIENLKKRILVSMDWDLNLVTIEVKMQDPMLVAGITEYTKEYITTYANNYSVSKSAQQLAFIKSQFNEKREYFRLAQSNLASFRDRNVNINSALAKSEEERLMSQYNIAFNIYNQLAQQMENIKLQVNENALVFTVLEPVKVPVNSSETSKFVILAICLIAGMTVSIGCILIIFILKNRYV